MEPHSIYLHIPFCRYRCSYCDFNTYTGFDELIPVYIQALCAEIRFARQSVGKKIPVFSIFLGGGTPTLLPVAGLARIFEVLNKEFDLVEGIEVSIEANPEELSFNYLQSLHEIGINRISLGAQSAEPGDLQLLNRQHDFSQVAAVVKLIRKAGFENLNLDLIFGIPNQSFDSWKRSLISALELQPEHLSLYALTIEPGTPMADWVKRGVLPESDPDLAADMYLWSAEELDRHGFRQYEISNWAQINSFGDILACKHNLQYWRNQPYLGFGAGAHGYANRIRTANLLSPRIYIDRCLNNRWEDAKDEFSFPLTPATADAQAISRGQEMGETMMMGLRLTEEGVSRDVFKRRFEQEIDDAFMIEVEQSIENGLLEWDFSNGERLRLTPQGRLLGNQVFIRFV